MQKKLRLPWWRWVLAETVVTAEVWGEDIFLLLVAVAVVAAVPGDAVAVVAAVPGDAVAVVAAVPGDAVALAVNVWHLRKQDGKNR